MTQNNEKFWRWLKISLILICTIGGLAVGYGALNERVNNNSKQITTFSEKADANQMAIVELRTDVRYIRSGIDEIKNELQKQ